MHETISFHKVELSKGRTLGITGVVRKGGFDGFGGIPIKNSKQLSQTPT